MWRATATATRPTTASSSPALAAARALSGKTAAKGPVIGIVS